MLSVKTQDGWLPITGYENYYIEKTEDGTEMLSFDISKGHPLFEKLKSEMLIRNNDNEFIITGVNLPSTIATITGELNLHEWKQEFYFKCSDIPALSTKLLVDVLEYIKPVGWSIINAHIRDIRRTTDTEKCNGYDILMRCRDIYNVWYDIDCLSKTIYVVDPNDSTDTGAYVTPELNMTGISYKESSAERVTRLYCYGKEDMTFADINNGKPYVECFDYTSDVLVGGWSDQRYDVKENFLADAVKKVKELAMPIGSYTIDVKDLAKVDDRYTYIKLALRHTVHCIVDPEKGLELKHRVVKIKWYPDEPGKRVVTLSNEPIKIQDKIKNVISAVGEDGQKITGSILQQAQKKAMELINTWATDGYVYLTENEIYILDKIPKEEAKYCIRMNLGGIAFSQQGWAGPYISAWTIDGRFNADFITAGTLRSIKIESTEIEGGSIKIGNFFRVSNEGVLTATRAYLANATLLGTVETVFGDLKATLSGGLLSFENAGVAMGSIGTRQLTDGRKGVAIELKSQAEYFNIMYETGTLSYSTALTFNKTDKIWSLGGDVNMHFNKLYNIAAANGLPGFTGKIPIVVDITTEGKTITTSKSYITVSNGIITNGPREG